jgi:hypothetical protein
VRALNRVVFPEWGFPTNATVVVVEREREVVAPLDVGLSVTGAENMENESSLLMTAAFRNTRRHADTAREPGGDTESGAVDFQHQRIAAAGDLYVPSIANAHGLETLEVIVVAVDAHHDGAFVGLQFVEALVRSQYVHGRSVDWTDHHLFDI